MGFAMRGDEQKARAAGCDGYITKPIDTRTLAARLREHLTDPAKAARWDRLYFFPLKDETPLADVRHVESWVGAGAAPLQPDGSQNLDAALNPVGSVEGLFFDEDRANALLDEVEKDLQPKK